MKFLAFALLLFATLAAAAAPKYPLKTGRTLHSDEEIARMRRNIEKYASARAVADSTIKAADKWVDWKDEDLLALLTDSKVPRAFAVSASGCPICGDKIKQHGGDYAWIIDPRLANKVKCPVDGTVFPDKDHPDDGWGWTDPKTGEKFWFVACYNHWMWHKYLVLGLRDLGNAYLITGDKRYAHKAAAMLHRIAEVYPAMDHAKQSRYGQMMAAKGADYPGKVVNAIWETGLAQCLAEGYDAVWETIDGDEALQKSTGKTGEQIRSFIEANVLEDAIDAYFTAKIRGNFGMHQRTLVYLALVRQNGENAKWFDMLLNESSSSYPTLGLNYALYNLISRDGVPMESAPGYNHIWVRAITDYGDLLSRGGENVIENPRVKRMYDAIIDQITVGKFTPDVGDSGNVWGGVVGLDAEMYQAAQRHFPDARFAAVLNRLTASGDDSFKSFDSLFADPIPASEAKLPPAKSRLLPGYGLAILNNPADTISMSLYSGIIFCPLA